MTTNRTGNFQVILDGRGEVTIRQGDHVATGGEGSVFRLAGTVIKVYNDPQKMRRDNMVDKIKALTVLQHPYIVAPYGLVLDERGTPIGLYMPYIKDSEPFPRVFTNDYWTRSGFDDKDASALVNRMQEVVKFAHDKRAIIVDGNELSWLLLMSGNGAEPRIIDVDSWSIGRWPPKVIMPSIRDWHMNGFNELTDWFSWGIVSFQVYTGIHPYKGTLDGYKPGELERRMQDNASVFAQSVRLNRNVRDFSRIPSRLLGWYVDTFQHGMREMPPSPFDTGVGAPRAAVVARTIVTTAGVLMYEKLYSDTRDPVIRIFPCGAVLLKSGRLYDLESKHELGTVKSRDCEVVKTEGRWLIADWDGDKLEFAAVDRNRNEERLNLNLNGYRLLQYNDRLFVHTDQGLTELKLKVVGRSFLVPDQTWGVMRYSTRWFDGVGIMDALGAAFVIVPFGDRAVAQVRVRELDGLKPVMAKAGNRFVAIMTIDKDGQYKKLELTFDRRCNSYTVWEGQADSPELNMAMLPRGVVAMITQDGELNIFVPTSGTLNKVQDKDITTDMILANWGDSAVYIRNGEVWSMRMQ